VLLPYVLHVHILRAQVPSSPPGHCLPAWDLSSRGQLLRIDGTAYTAGKLTPAVGSRMARAAADSIHAALMQAQQETVWGRPALAAGLAAAETVAASAGPRPDGERTAAAVAESRADRAAAAAQSAESAAVIQPVIDIRAVHEPPEHACGDGGGIMLVATTSTGCLLGACTTSAAWQ
jgi:hypothetical protein